MTAPPRDTALFFDLENLVGGYEPGLASRVEQISVHDIVEQITAVGQSNDLIHEYAVKRAYADWSKSQLAMLRRALIEQGIEPRQVFAFGSGGKTNAADVELVIDVLDLAYTRPEITTFVVVSGDGGFGTLIRKLHEFGKCVFVCASKRKAAKGLRAVADHFVEIKTASAEQSDQAPREARAQPTPQRARASAQVSKRIPSRVKLEAEVSLALSDVASNPVSDPDAIREAVLESVDRLAKQPSLARLIAGAALDLEIVAKPLRNYLGHSEIETVFGSLSRLLRIALAGSPWCLATNLAEPRRVFLAARESLPVGYAALDDLTMPTAADQARSRLRAARVHLPDDPEDLAAVIAALGKTPIVGKEDGEALMYRLLQDDLLADIETAGLRQSISVLRSAGTLIEEGEGPVANRRYGQVETDPHRMLTLVRKLVLTATDPPIEDAILDELIQVPADVAGAVEDRDVPTSSQ